MRPKTIALAMIALGIALVLRLVYLHPLWMSAESIRGWMLTQVPLGASMEQTERFISERGWNRHYSWHGVPSEISEKVFPGVSGSRIIGAVLGNYQGIPFHIDLDAYWGFDASGRLVALRVRKMRDAL